MKTILVGKKQVDIKIYEDNVKLCRAVEAQPPIYDRKYQCEYKDVCDAWTAVAAAVGDTATSCRTRWQKIRFAFMRSLWRTKMRLPNITKKYYLHDELEFFKPHLTRKNWSGSDDEMEVLETDKTATPQKSACKSPVKESGTLDAERTTSAIEMVEETEQTSAASDKKKSDTFFIKKQVGDAGKFIIKKKNKEMNDGDDDDKADDDGVKIVEKPEKVLKEKDKTEPKEATVDSDRREFRFSRACKRNMDKSIVNQLRDPSPNRAVENKRTRRGLWARRATLKPRVETTKFMKTTSPKVQQIAKEQEEIPIQQQLEKSKEQLEVTQHKSVPKVEQMLTNHAFIPSDIVETQMEPSPVAEQPVLIQWASTPASKTFVADGNMPCEPFLLPASMIKIDRGVQCDKEIQRSACDDEFLNMLRPQMAAMNARQKVHFKQKIYKSLIEVFDDSSNFPNSDEVPSASAFPVPPFPGVSSTTGAEMCLIRELVALVQAAKLTPEFVKPQEKGQDYEEVAANSDKTTPVTTEVAKMSTEVAATQTDAPPTSASKVIYRTYLGEKEHAFDEATQRHLMRKVVKVSGMVNSQEGEKKRIYRIFNKGGGSVVNTTPISSSGVFIIPPTQGSNGSAGTAGTASTNSTATLGSQDSVYRPIPISGDTVYGSAAGTNSTTPNLRRMMTIRSTVRPSGTCVPRQILRRYSICGAGNMASMDKITPTKIITTSCNTPSQETKAGFNKNPNAPNVRYVRTTATATPPCKLPQLPTTTVTQTLTTKTTPIAQFLNHQLPVKPAATPTISPAIGMHSNRAYSLSGFNSIFPNSSSSTSLAVSPPPIVSTVTINNSTIAMTSPRLRIGKSKDKTAEGQQQTAMQKHPDDNCTKTGFQPKARHTDTAATIASDYFGSINIKKEPLEHISLLSDD